MAAICWYGRAAVAAGSVSTVQFGVLWALSVAGVVLVGKRKPEVPRAVPQPMAEVLRKCFSR